MKKVLMVLGGTLLAIAVAAAVGISILAVKGSALDKESQEFANESILAVVSGWDADKLISRASPEFMSATNGRDLGKLFGWFRMLGKLKEYKGCKGHATISVTSQQGKVITAAYTGRGDFERGPAEINITLIKRGDRWQILGFRINSKLLFEQT
ncbi:hypothetical protein [Cupriavidus basilensis]|uniref:hypothetical protein n=1 Tax=Cupriavidus basilensis TaxID=68895 RepID=UPI0005BB7142|nr:hypothetical protein [Cupriavidus basilensis]